MAHFSVLRTSVPVSVFMFSIVPFIDVVRLVSFIANSVSLLDCFGPRGERPPSPDADSLLSHSSQFNSTLDR